MATSNAIINITNLRLRTFIGFNPEEQQKQQDIVINAEILYTATHLCLSDNVDNALNYKLITKKIIQHIEEGRFLLLEKLSRTGQIRLDRTQAGNTTDRNTL